MTRIFFQDVLRARDGERDEAVCWFLDIPSALRLVERVVFCHNSCGDAMPWSSGDPLLRALFPFQFNVSPLGVRT